MVFTALFPVFGLIVLGFILRHFGFPFPGFWPGAERLTYFVAFPALLFTTLANSPQNPVTAMPMSVAVFGAVCLTALAALLLRKRTGFTGPRFTSVFQGSIRPNTYVGLAAVAGLLGAEGLAAAAVVLAIIVPTVNVLSVSVLSKYGAAASRNNGETLKRILTNPLLLACAAGIIANVAGVRLPESAMGLLVVLGRAALPLGLLAVGAGLRPTAAWPGIKEIGVSSGLKIFLFPLLCMAFLKLLGVGGVQAGAAMLFAAAPTSVSSYVLAGQMGGDSELMAAIITAQTLIATVTLTAVAVLI